MHTTDRLPAKRTVRLVCGLSVVFMLLAGCTSAQVKQLDQVVPVGQTPVQPEGSSGYAAQAEQSFQHWAVATANPLATAAGYRVLADGGNAIDAAVAAQMVLGLVEPQSSGIGGGAFLLHYDGNGVTAYDGREVAPMAADEALFLDRNAKPMPFFNAVVGGRAVGVPGAVSMLEKAHAAQGKLPWARLFESAITLAEQGFSVGTRLNKLLQADTYLRQDPQAAAYFYDNSGQAWPVGHMLRNPELAGVLRLIAAQGAKGLMEGEVAQAIVNKVQQHPSNPGRMKLDDLAQYQAIARAPFCSDYKRFRICGMPPPSSGAITVAQILGLLSHTPQAGASTLNPDWLHYYMESSRLAFADRARYIADPDFVEPPANSWHSLVDPNYLSARAKLMSERRMGKATHGNPGSQTVRFGVMPDQPEFGTSHISIIDGNGHAVAMTTTIENGFGARQMVKGFLLNNQLTDFSFAPKDGAGLPIANRVQAGKRPRSSMAPTLVFDKETKALLLSVGSPGGSLIIHYTAKTLVGMLDWQLSPQRAINLPNFANNNGTSLLEKNMFEQATVDALEARGHVLRHIDMTSGLQAVEQLQPNAGAPRIRAGADPRREGLVMGD